MNVFIKAKVVIEVDNSRDIFVMEEIVNVSNMSDMQKVKKDLTDQHLLKYVSKMPIKRMQAIMDDYNHNRDEMHRDGKIHIDVQIFQPLAC